ncbi:MAG: hypothetical protein ACRCVU_19320, partial [Flavobacterium sp.]
EGLPRKTDYMRKVVLNQEGHVATMDYDVNSFNLKTLKYVKNTSTFHSPKGLDVMNNERGDLEIGLNLEVILPPKTENILFLEYDVPIYTYNEKEKNFIIVGYIGVTLIKEEEGKAFKELDEGSRKLTNYEGRASKKGDDFFGASLTGKAIDKVSNPTDKDKKVTYKLYGYVEKGNYNNIDREVYFGNGDGKIESLGVGFFNVAVFEKNI